MIPPNIGKEIDMQHGLTEEQVLLRDTVRKLAKENVDLVFEVALDIWNVEYSIAIDNRQPLLLLKARWKW